MTEIKKTQICVGCKASFVVSKNNLSKYFCDECSKKFLEDKTFWEREVSVYDYLKGGLYKTKW